MKSSNVKLSKLFLMMTMTLGATACNSSDSDSGGGNNPVQPSSSITTQEEPTTVIQGETAIFKSTLSYGREQNKLAAIKGASSDQSLKVEDIDLQDHPDGLSFKVVTRGVDNPCWDPKTGQGATLIPGESCHIKAEVDSDKAQHVETDVLVASNQKTVHHPLSMDFIDRDKIDASQLPSVTLLNEPMIVPSSKVQIQVKNTSDKQVNNLQVVLPDYLEAIAKDKHLSQEDGLNPNQETTLSFYLDGSQHTVDVLKKHVQNLANNASESNDFYVKAANLKYFYLPLTVVAQPLKKPDNVNSFNNIDKVVRKKVALENVSSNPIQLNQATLEGQDLSGISIQDDQCSNRELEPHEVCHLTLDVATNAQGSGKLKLHYTTQQGDAFDLDDFDISVDNTLKPSDIDLKGPNVIIRSNTDAPIKTKLTLLNDGQFDWQTPNQAQDYTFDDSTGLEITSGSCLTDQSVKPGESCTLEIQADRQAHLDANELTIHQTGNLSADKTIPVTVQQDNLNISSSGTNQLPDVMSVGKTARFNVIVSNHSSAEKAVNINSIDFKDGSVYQIDTENSSCTDQTTLAPGDHCNIWVNVTSQIDGDFNDTLLVDTDDPKAGTLEKVFNTTVVPENSDQLVSLNLDHQPKVSPGHTTSITIANTTNQALNHVALNVPDWLKDFVKSDLVLKQDLKPGQSHTFRIAVPDNQETESLIQSHYKELTHNAKQQGITVTAANMQTIAPEIKVGIQPGQLSEKQVEIHQRDVSVGLHFVNTSNDRLLIDDLGTLDLPKGVSIDQDNSTCIPGASLGPNETCVIKFIADEKAVGQGNIHVHYHNSQGKQLQASSDINVGGVIVRMQRGTRTVDKPIDGSVEPKTTPIKITNGGPFDWHPSTNASDYQILANKTAGVEPKSMTISSDPEQSTCLSGDTVKYGDSCQLAVVVSDYRVKPGMYDLKILNDTTNLDDSYRHSFAVKANKPSLTSSVNPDHNHLRLKSIKVTNNGTGHGVFTYQLNDQTGNFELWQGKDNDWCTKKSCPNPCDLSDSTVELDADKSCNIYVHDQNLANSDNPSLDANFSINDVQNNSMNYEYHLQSQAYLYAGTFEKDPTTLYRVPLNDIKGTWQPVVSFDDQGNMDGLAAAANGDLYLGRNEDSNIYQVAKKTAATSNDAQFTLDKKYNLGRYHTASLDIDGNQLYVGTQHGFVFKGLVSQFDQTVDIIGTGLGSNVDGLTHHNGNIYAATSKNRNVYQLNSKSNTWDKVLSDDTGSSHSLVAQGNALYQGTGMASVYQVSLPLTDSSQLHQIGDGPMYKLSPNENPHTYGLVVENGHTIYASTDQDEYLHYYDGSQWQTLTAMPHTMVRLLENAEMTIK